ncbi:DUF2911 domain-containing protein [Maribacter sp. ANRC-HE7]|uniref:DUF2911 domain-containing protein n=1 Tax=Maribacter aquimaris TaxID=2737171 RepID=A0ABR7UYI5_9FLAO|nr:DUF2911 domain-containing protein [Maribacter aquimaris]MBD0777307.1 DUF2911 domain-containing protein [Maribacter aquimaris]
MKKIQCLIILISVSFQLNGQDTDYPYPSFSPKGNLSQIVGNTLISVEYERPSARKRLIYGGLVPWNNVWRTGAGNCTKIAFDKEVTIGGQKVLAGNYSIFTIPNPNEWVVIINKDTTLYGSYNYNSKNDVARFTAVPVETNRYYETLNFDIELNQHNAKMYVSWANTQIKFNIATSTNYKMEKLIREELMTGINQVSNTYAGAASYLTFREMDYETALKLAEKAIELDKNNEWGYGIKIEIYERLKLYENAITEINRELEILNKNKENRSEEIKKLESEYKRLSKLQE